MASLTSTLSIVLKDDVTKPARSVAQALKDTESEIKSISKAMAGTGATDKFVASLSKLRVAKSEIEQVASAWKNYAASAGLAGNASSWTKSQIAGVRSWETQTIASLRAVKREQATFSAQQRKFAASGDNQKSGAKDSRLNLLPLGVGYLAAHTGKEEVKKIVDKYREADRSLRYQGAMAELTPEERASRFKQATTLGPEAGVNPQDILKAQEKLAGRGVKKQFVEPFTGELVNYARAMDASLEDSAKTLETIIFSTNQSIEDAATAAKVMRRQIDIAVKAAKMGGLSDEDVQLGAKFGAASAHGAGFKNETIFAIMAALSRAGYHGDEAGVATRAISSKLVSPSAKGMDALSAMGIDYNKYTKMPGGMSPNNLDSMQKRRFGKGLTKGQLSGLQEIFDNPDIVSNRGEFVAHVSAVIGETFEKNKKGKTKAQDAQKIAKLAGDFYKQAIESVDVEGLLTDILEKHPTMQQLNSLFTSQHGGKVEALSERVETFKEILNALNTLPEGFAKTIGDERMAGVAGSLDRLNSSTDSLALRIGDADAALIKWSADLAASLAKKASEAPDKVIQGGTALAGAAVLGVTGAAAKAWLGGMTVREIISSGIGMAGRSIPIFAAAGGLITVIEDAAEKGVMKGAIPTGKGILDTQPMGKPWLPPTGKAAPIGLPLPTPENMASAAQAKVDGSQVDALKQKADAAKASVDTLNTTVTPNVDKASIDAANGAVSQLLANLAKVGTMAANIQSTVNNIKIPSLGSIQRGHFSAGGVQGE